MKETIFLSTDKGATRVFDDKGLVLKFRRLNNNLIKNNAGDLMRTNESDDWVCVTENEDLIKRAKAHPNFNKEFKIVDRLPSKRGATIAVSKPSENSLNVEDAIRLGELKAVLFKKDGKLVKNSDPELIKEYKSLQSSFPDSPKIEEKE